MFAGVLAGAAWVTTGSLFTSFIVNVTRNEAIYSGFAIVLAAMIWLQMSWLILLLGAQLAFYLQNPTCLRPREAPRSDAAPASTAPRE
jgi:membrane protein